MGGGERRQAFEFRITTDRTYIHDLDVVRGCEGKGMKEEGEGEGGGGGEASGGLRRRERGRVY